MVVRHQNIELQDMLVVDYEKELANIKRKSISGRKSGGEEVGERVLTTCLYIYYYQ